jgi:hypothetical protein
MPCVVWERGLQAAGSYPNRNKDRYIQNMSLHPGARILPLFQTLFGGEGRGEEEGEKNERRFSIYRLSLAKGVSPLHATDSSVFGIE